ncbi:MAG: lipoyl(octanoyl) transferase LipB [Gemmatimonadetes bacterium]|nr:lipoyl(octanoyl) transferase LipB [Gemmatimonadota bacterium]
MAAPKTVRPSLIVLRPGTVSYADGLEMQEDLVEARKRGEADDHLLLLEHHSVYTLGRRGDLGHVRIDDAVRERLGIELFHTNRGGDVTWHGPGQLVGYPIVSLAPDRKDLVRYVRDLEEVLIRALRDFGIEAARVAGLTGVWVGDEKIAAIGVRVARWVTSHGFALNVCNGFEAYDHIVPCGIADRGVTSLSRLLGRDVTVDETADRVVTHFADVFEREITTPEMLETTE